MLLVIMQNRWRFFNPFNIPYYRKLTLVLINVLEINAT